MSRDSAQGLAQLYGANLSWRKWAAFVGVVLLGATSLAAQVAGRQNRISQATSAKPNTELSGTVHPLTARATDLGSVNSNLQLNSMTLNIALSAGQKQEIAALQKALQNPNSPQYHKFLTQAEYGARFGLTDADLSQLKSWLASQGFTVNGVSKTRTSISFSGKTSQVESAFQTQLHQYKLNGETHFANATALHVPAQFAGVILSVSGLDTFRPKPRTNRISARPYYTLDSSDYFLTPADWATIYSLNSIYTAGFDGTGVHVGVVGQTYAPQADIDNFRTAAGLSATKLTYACISSADCTDAAGISQSDLGEADVDIEWAGGIAKNATVDFIYAAADDPNQGAFEALTYAVNSYATADGSVVPVISMSYGSCETQLAGSTVQLLDQLGAQANVQGQTLVVASGDSGPAGCDPSNDPGTPAATQGLSVEAPADSGNFTSVGGTTLSGDENNPATYWNQTLGQVNTALQYIPEIAWNETNQVSAGLDASGGGESTLITQPSWQSGLISSTTGRLVPDVAFSAAANHDAYLFCSASLNSAAYGTTCANGTFVSSGGTAGTALTQGGGTSVPTPAFAGMLALFVQRYGPLGNINPTLYGLFPAYSSSTNTTNPIFNDITVGDNIVPCVAPPLGSPDCDPSTLQMGYVAGTGYDEVTGLGSIIGGALFSELKAQYPDPASTTTVTVSPSQVLSGGTATFTANVSSLVAGSITGTDTFTNAGTTFASPVTPLTNGGVATWAVAATTANGFVLGSNPVTATYNLTPPGGGNYLSSVGITELTVLTSSFDPSQAPLLFALSSSTAPAGGQGFTLSVYGANFVPASVVLWNGTARPTTYVSGTQLNVAISAADIALDGTNTVSVSNPAPNAGVSSSLPFAVIVVDAIATITGDSRSLTADGSGNYALTVTGKDFVLGSLVQWNGTGLTTTYVSSGILSATIPAGLAVTAPVTLTVSNPAGTSPGFNLQ